MGQKKVLCNFFQTKKSTCGIDKFWSFFKSELTQLDIWGWKKDLIYSCLQSKCTIWVSNQINLIWNTKHYGSDVYQVLKFGISRFRGPSPLTTKDTQNFESHF